MPETPETTGAPEPAGAPDPSKLRPSITDLAVQRVEQFARPDLWPTPNWLTDEQRPARRFESYWLSHLRGRYLELETRFLSLLGNFAGDEDFDRTTSGRIEEVLRVARVELEDDDDELQDVHARLDLVERSIPQLLPPDEARAEALAVVSQLSEAGLDTDLAAQISGLAQQDLSEREALVSLRAGLCEGRRRLTGLRYADWLGGKLQIARLIAWRRWAALLVLTLVVLAPILVQKEGLKSWTLLLPSKILAVLPAFVPTDTTAWVNAGAVAVIGASGGALSALLAVRRSRVSLLEYESNRISMQLKVLIGALVATLSFVLLSWNLLPGVEITHAGSYLLVAFLSGFSERYFLQLLKVDDPRGSDVEPGA
ncbi:MAG: hypothetical protein H6739_27460 [Alphaproteobacteria bacterium]|nr:hypothetical protein [Alphaproteobacteria bacterium]